MATDRPTRSWKRSSLETGTWKRSSPAGQEGLANLDPSDERAVAAAEIPHEHAFWAQRDLAVKAGNRGIRQNQVGCPVGAHDDRGLVRHEPPARILPLEHEQADPADERALILPRHRRGDGIPLV
jgi:hypothetical protein